MGSAVWMSMGRLGKEAAAPAFFISFFFFKVTSLLP